MEDSFLQNAELLFHHQIRKYNQGFIHTPQICISLVTSQTIDFFNPAYFFSPMNVPFCIP